MTLRSASLRLRIVRIGPADTVRVAEKARPLLDGPADPVALRRYLSDRRNYFLVAWDGEVAVGFLRATALGQILTRRPQMFLYEISVAESHRRRGVGRRLVERLLRFSRARHFDEVFVFTDPANRAAVGLYRATGATTETPGDRMYVYPLQRDPTGPRATR